MALTAVAKVLSHASEWSALSTETKTEILDQGDPAQNHPVGLQPLDAFPARRRGQSDSVADLGHGERGVLLQHGQDLTVDGVEATVGFMKLNG